MSRFALIFSFLVGAFLLASPVSWAADAAPVAEVFPKDFGTLARQSGQTGIPVFCTITPKKGETPELLSDRRVLDRYKWFLPLNVQPTTRLAKALAAEAPTLTVVLDSEGKVLGRYGPADKVDDFMKQLDEIGKQSRAGFLGKLTASDTTAAGSKTAVSGLIRMGGSAAELMPLLRHRSTEVKAAVAKALPTLPEDDVALAALAGLASDDVEMRAASYKWAATAAPFSKAQPLKFWREADEAKRKEALEQWREAANTNMGPLNKGIIEFCESNLGKQVARGECSDLGTESFKLLNAMPMKHSGKTYIWGREVTTGQKVLPGDIVQLEDCKFKNSTASHHTQVIRKVLGPNRYEVLEQNVNGRRTVGPGTLDLNNLIEGSVKIYRPVPRN